MGGFNPPGNRPRWGAEMQIHVQGSSRYHIIPGIPLIASELLTFATLGDHRRYVCISKTVIAYRSAPFDITHHPISPEFACLDRAEALKHRRWKCRLRPFLDIQARRRMASAGRKENGGFRQLACQSGHSRPRCLMAALDPKRSFKDQVRFRGTINSGVRSNPSHAIERGKAPGQIDDVTPVRGRSAPNAPSGCTARPATSVVASAR